MGVWALGTFTSTQLFENKYSFRQCKIQTTKNRTLSKTEVAIKNGYSRAWQHWVHKPQDEDKQSKKHNTVCVGNHHTQDACMNIIWTLLIFNIYYFVILFLSVYFAMMFISLELSLIVYHVLSYLCLIGHSGVQPILRSVLLLIVYPIFPVSLDCPSIFSNVYYV